MARRQPYRAGRFVRCGSIFAGRSRDADLSRIAEYGPLIVDGHPLTIKAEPAATPVGPEVTAAAPSTQAESERAVAGL